jgi:predicted RNA-binding protein with PIN domain
MAKNKQSGRMSSEPGVERTIVIDGYNLILRSPAFRPDDRRDLAQARDKLVNLLSWAVGRGEVEFIVVFDGAETGPGQARSSKSGRIAVHFSTPPQNADQLIEEIVEELEDRGRTVTVVTSDIEVARHARTHGASVALSDLFASSLFPERVAEDLAKQKAQASGDSAEKPLGFSKKDMKEWLEMFSKQKKDEEDS